MSQAAGTLSLLSDLEGWTGEAATKFADEASGAHGDLQKASTKYTDAASALSIYAGHVGEARDATIAAVRKAVLADDAMRATSESLTEGVDDPSDELKEDERRRDEAHSNAQSDLSDARAELDRAMSILEQHASNCAARINSASENFKDSTMDNVRGFIAAAVDVLNVIAILIVAIIIVVLIVFTAGAFLGVVAFASGLISLLLTVGTIVGGMILALTLVQFAMGDADLGDVGLAVLGVVGGPLGKLGGRLASPAIRSMTAVARGSAAATARSSVAYRITARLADATRVRFLALGDRVPLASIREGLEASNTRMVDDAVAGVDRTIDTLPEAGPFAQAFGPDDLINTGRTSQALQGMADMPSVSVNQVRAAMAAQGGEALTGALAQANDIVGFPEALSNTVENGQNLSDTVSFDAPDRPTRVVDVVR